MSTLDFLNPLNIAADAIRKLVDVWTTLKDRKDKETTSMLADLSGLMEELRKTHFTIVKLVSPLRRTSDDPLVFGKEFTGVYNDFRDFYDANTFGEERTRCHKIREIQSRMLKRIPLFGSDTQWNELDTSLGALSTADFDIIDNQYKPFMASLNETMTSIKQHVDNNDVPRAIIEKTAFLASLGPEYDKNKKMLEEMTDTIGTLTAGL